MTARILDQRNADRRCIIEVPPCPREATDRGMCAVHSHYFRVVLADNWYRNHPVPESEEAPQLALRFPSDAAYLRREPGRKGGT